MANNGKGGANGGAGGINDPSINNGIGGGGGGKNGGDPDQKGSNGCKGIDFLVVVDNSLSMSDEQINLANSFPKFLNTIKKSVKTSATEFNVLVADTDSDGCEFICDAGSEYRCGPWGAFNCSTYEKPSSMSCENALGSGRRKSGLGIDCKVNGDKRYFDSSQSDSDEVFRCLGQQGVGGDPAERPIDAMLAAVSDEMVGKGGCNEGFIRDDAILVVVLITDEEDDGDEDELGGSANNPEDWHKQLLKAKGGDKGGVVVVGLVGDTGTDDGICQELKPGGRVGAERSPRLIEFVESFDKYGRWGSVCAHDYSPFLQEVVDLITESCEEFDPPD